MIRAIQGYNQNFTGIKNLKAQKVARNVVNAEHSAPKGLSKSPVRYEKDILDELGDAVNKRTDESGPLGVSLTTILGTGALAIVGESAFS